MHSTRELLTLRHALDEKQPEANGYGRVFTGVLEDRQPRGLKMLACLEFLFEQPQLLGGGNRGGIGLLSRRVIRPVPIPRARGAPRPGDSTRLYTQASPGSREVRDHGKRKTLRLPRVSIYENRQQGGTPHKDHGRSQAQALQGLWPQVHPAASEDCDSGPHQRGPESSMRQRCQKNEYRGGWRWCSLAFASWKLSPATRSIRESSTTR